jgi:dTDP-4-amino-4,6-dideoxygalactose transaminase
VFHQYTIRIEEEKRDAVQKALQEKGVSTMVYYPFPLHRMKVFSEGRGVSAGSLPSAEEACRSVLSLPIEPLQRTDETMYVVETLRSCLRVSGGEKEAAQSSF